ncbi:unnamed protein product [Lactuca virosa]|uniref:Uncharacterized protein n=1 Tax=Lactuca virosa TaxID=75947 RepID=A0AAU9MHH0_9ASTR|nr:unnamed protein product [Lactuca virosa]
MIVGYSIESIRMTLKQKDHWKIQISTLQVSIMTWVAAISILMLPFSGWWKFDVHLTSQGKLIVTFWMFLQSLLPIWH